MPKELGVHWKERLQSCEYEQMDKQTGNKANIGEGQANKLERNQEC